MTMLLLEFMLRTDRLHARLQFGAPEPPTVEVLMHGKPVPKRQTQTGSDDSLEPPRQFMPTAH